MSLIPLRMLNEFVYCPRLFHLEHVQGLFRESADTVKGSFEHDRSEASRPKSKHSAGPSEQKDFELDRTATRRSKSVVE